MSISFQVEVVLFICNMHVNVLIGKALAGILQSIYIKDNSMDITWCLPDKDLSVLKIV